MATHDLLPIRQPIAARPGSLTRGLAASLALTLSTVLALTLPHALGSSGHAATPVLKRLDFHSTSLDSSELELNVAVGTGNDCKASLNAGQYCLRYSVTQEDAPKDVGFGVIPSSAVQINGPTLALKVDTTRAGFHHLAGSGGQINLTWHPGPPGLPATARGHTTRLASSSVSGTVDGNAVAGPEVQASYLVENQ